MAATEDNGIEAEFRQYSGQLEADLAVVDAVKETSAELAKAARAPMQALHAVHRACDPDAASRAVRDARQALQPCVQLLGKLAAQVPAGSYYKYHQLWRNCAQQLCLAVAFINFLEADRLLGLAEAAAELGLLGEPPAADASPTQFHLDLEDYLFGLLCLASELARLSVNSVTAGCLAMPRRVADYARRLEAGFRLLNFKNDALRRRYDGLKYDMRKIEEVLYDVSVRRLE